MLNESKRSELNKEVFTLDEIKNVNNRIILLILKTFYNQSKPQNKKKVHAISLNQTPGRPPAIPYGWNTRRSVSTHNFNLSLKTYSRISPLPPLYFPLPPEFSLKENLFNLIGYLFSIKLNSNTSYSGICHVSMDSVSSLPAWACSCTTPNCFVVSPAIITECYIYYALTSGDITADNSCIVRWRQ
ncbi:hypothetical protein BpHYR1_029159 [Brachionus plicatilis]|uniref:Uncharacterized protein n=1 Tax=Brachionus plicatilis TaxID=10195 RepID=A0A3M7SA40_BRAPC|nr:hypothetical protein BpHYR1_029159 [Brachionus plicatilis]